MNVHLLYRDKDFNLQQDLPWNSEAVIQDLELDTMLKAMADENEFTFEVAKTVILSGLDNDEATIRYHQQILRDCLKNPDAVESIYTIAVESIKKEKENYLGIFSDYPDAILSRSMKVLQIFIEELKKLRNLADGEYGNFGSEGFKNLFEMLKRELTDEYFAEMQNHLALLKFKNGVLISGQLGEGNKGKNYTLRKLANGNKNWWERFKYDYLFPWLENSDKKWIRRLAHNNSKKGVYNFYIHYRDESGIRALRNIKDEGINLAANALAQSDDHILNSFVHLKSELAFYRGCMALYNKLASMEAPVFFPEPMETGHLHDVRGLYDVSLALTMNRHVVGNEFRAENKDLIMVTGANQGGKSTFLRSIGVAQLMMQSGMFVPAEYFRANICDSLLTHFKREEDTEMESGKLDEELSRMDEIIRHMTPETLLLFNESFCATNEREGAEIANQITGALLEKGIKIFFVTHLYEFANRFYKKQHPKMLFLRAERKPDGTRTFKIIEGAPQQTSFGKDLYNDIFRENKGNEPTE